MAQRQREGFVPQQTSFQRFEANIGKGAVGSGCTEAGDKTTCYLQVPCFILNNEPELSLSYRDSGRRLSCWCRASPESLCVDLLHMSDSDTQFVTVPNSQGQCLK